MHYDIIILGGGISGLSAGIRLAHFGKTVRIFERHALPGGLNSYYVRNGKIYNTGLHALTNFATPEDKSAPFNRALRQLRIARKDLCLEPQTCSRITIGNTRLQLNNDFRQFIASAEAQFPNAGEQLRKLADFLLQTNYTGQQQLQGQTARELLRQFITYPILRDAILMPVMFYGNPRNDDDMDALPFSILFNSIFMEGLGRPRLGMKPLITILTEQFAKEGGILSLGNPIKRLMADGTSITGVLDVHGEIHTADNYISTIGLPETARLCHEPIPGLNPQPGNVAFCETILELNCHPQQLGIDFCIDFHCDEAEFHFSPANNLSTYLLCAPGNYLNCQNADDARLLKMSCLTNADDWLTKNEDGYAAAKSDLAHHQIDYLERLYPGLKSKVVSSDVYTPRTFLKFTGRLNGAIYGTPDRIERHPFEGNLYFAGTDTGLLGVTGALVSGTLVANELLV